MQDTKRSSSSSIQLLKRMINVLICSILLLSIANHSILSLLWIFTIDINDYVIIIITESKLASNVGLNFKNVGWKILGELEMIIHMSSPQDTMLVSWQGDK